MTSDSTSETDSQPPTAGTSLLDVSNRSHSTRKRSSSRASLGSRGKSLRLSLEQKNGIASREMDRIEHELMEFRVRSRKETREGMAEINERVLKLEEVEKSRNLLVKGIAQAKLPVKEIGNSKSKDAPPVKYDYEKLADFFRTEIAAEKRMFLKLETRNGVTSSQISRVLSQVRTVQSASEESGPVNLEQLRLENENHCSLLHSQNLEVIALRKAMVGTRRRKNYYMEKLTVEAARRERLKKDLMNQAKVKEAVSKSIGKIFSYHSAVPWLTLTFDFFF